MSCKSKCIFDGKKCNSNQCWNSDKCLCGYEKRHVCEENYIWNPAASICKNGKYSANIIDDSVITCEEITDAEGKSIDEEAKTVPTNFNEKNITCKAQNFYILLTFLLITIAL